MSFVIPKAHLSHVQRLDFHPTWDEGDVASIVWINQTRRKTLVMQLVDVEIRNLNISTLKWHTRSKMAVVRVHGPRPTKCSNAKYKATQRSRAS